MKNTKKRNGFYMNISQEERRVINMLRDQYAINVSQAFKLFLDNMLKEKESKDAIQK